MEYGESVTGRDPKASILRLFGESIRGSGGDGRAESLSELVSLDEEGSASAKDEESEREQGRRYKPYISEMQETDTSSAVA
jgi:hypothetical protein